VPPFTTLDTNETDHQRVDMENQQSLTPRKRSNIYRWLSSLFRTEVTAEFLDAMVANQETLKQSGFDPGEAFFCAEKEDLLEQLAVEYARLFIGPGSHIPLMESVHRPESGNYWGESTAEVMKVYEHYGLSIPEDRREFPDHLSVCLEFMDKLTEFEQAAEDQQKEDERARCVEAEKMFFTRHIGNWVPTLCENILAAHPLPFYRIATLQLNDFIACEMEHFS
jgi:TorA maturation chaperone TorD